MSLVPRVIAVDGQGKVYFARDVGQFLHQYAVHGYAGGAGLVGNQAGTQQAGGKIPPRRRRVNHPDAAGQTAPAGVRLGLDDGAPAEIGDSGGGIGGRRRYPAFGHGDAVAGENRFGLVFVQVS